MNKPIKKLLPLITVILFTVSTVRASLIDLTPGGFNETTPWPQAVLNFFWLYNPGGIQNIAGANIIGGQPVWSPFTLFNGPPNFDATMNGAFNAAADWNLLGTGLRERFVFVESNDLFANLYLAFGKDQYLGNGTVDIGGHQIDGITFAGIRQGVPDTGATLILFGSAIGVLMILSRWRINIRTLIRI